MSTEVGSGPDMGGLTGRIDRDEEALLERVLHIGLAARTLA